MQHPDEGTIHAWLDGALSGDEAARVEAHVKDCPQCQAAVAEARGFIAASSRILTALDDAPRGVIPAAAPKKGVQPWVWRVAATVLVVAGGTWATLRQLGGEKSYRQPSNRTEAAQPTADLAQSTADTAAVPAMAEAAAAQPRTAAQLGRTVPRSVQLNAPRANSQPMKGATTGSVSGALRAENGERAPQLEERRIASAARARSEPSSPPTAPAPMMRAQNMAAMDFAVPTPREVNKKRMIGKTQTFYEMSAGDTVMLEEQTPVQLSEVVTSGAAVSTNRRAQPLAARTTAKAAAAPETQQKTEATPAPPPAVMLQASPGAEIHSISWLDRSSGRVLILSGRHSQEELQAIRQRIQELRDAAQSKKNPE